MKNIGYLFSGRAFSKGLFFFFIIYIIKYYIIELYREYNNSKINWIKKWPFQLHGGIIISRTLEAISIVK